MSRATTARHIQFYLTTIVVGILASSTLFSQANDPLLATGKLIVLEPISSESSVPCIRVDIEAGVWCPLRTKKDSSSSHLQMNDPPCCCYKITITNPNPYPGSPPLCRFTVSVDPPLPNSICFWPEVTKATKQGWIVTGPGGVPPYSYPFDSVDITGPPLDQGDTLELCVCARHGQYPGSFFASVCVWPCDPGPNPQPYCCVTGNFHDPTVCIDAVLSVPSLDASPRLILGPIPNPALSGSVQFTVGSVGMGRITCRVLDVSGTVLSSEIIGTQPNAKYTLRVDTSKLPAGTYFFSVTYPKGTVSREFHVVR